MVDLNALIWALPAYRIQTDKMARVTGRRGDKPLIMFVPPAGWSTPAVEPELAIEFVLVEAGWMPERAGVTGRNRGTSLLQAVPVEQRPVLIDEQGRARFCTSIHCVADALSDLGEPERTAVDALIRYGERVGRAKLITGDSLLDLASGPPPDAWTEAWFDLGSGLIGAGETHDADSTLGSRSADTWLAETIPIAADIARAIGGPVLDPPGDEAGNGYFYHGDVHRWLMLDFACFYAPDSPFVAFLVEASHAASIADLRATLRAPSSYSPDYCLMDAFTNYPSVCCVNLGLEEEV